MTKRATEYRRNRRLDAAILIFLGVYVFWVAPDVVDTPASSWQSTVNLGSD